jgi:hypothetical protein
MHNELQKITTQYSETEDRIALTGQTAAGDTYLIWFTRRALSRLLPVILEWIEKQGGSSASADLMQEFAQQAARADLVPQAPVQAGEGSRSWVAQSVDIHRDEQQLRLTFRHGADHASLGLDPLAARQWLNIVHDTFVLAEWPLQGWPAWLCDSAPAMATPAVLH